MNASPFTFGSTNNAGDYLDHWFFDDLPKGIRRQWLVSEEVATGSLYGILQRSETDDSEFDLSIRLPKKIVDCLFGLLS